MKKSSNLLLVLKMAFVVVILSAFFNANSQAVVSVDKMNVLYRGLENPISVAVAGVDAKLVQLIATDAKLNQVDDIHYTIVPTGSSRVVSLRVFSVKGNDTTEHGNFRYRVLPLPSPEMRIAGVVLDDEPTVLFAKLRAHPYLLVELPNFIFEVSYNVVSYSLLYQDGEDFVKEKINGSQIPNSVLEKLSKIEKPFKVTIMDLVVQGPDGSKKAALGASFFVK